jgi:hypothetical protein
MLRFTSICCFLETGVRSGRWDHRTIDKSPQNSQDLSNRPDPAILTDLVQAPMLGNDLHYGSKQSTQRPSGYRTPFWLSAANYYIFAVAISIALFFVVWGILNDGLEKAPWIGAGALAAVVLCGAVLLREVIMRTARNRFLQKQRELDRSIRSAGPPVHGRPVRAKITIEQNNDLIRQIKKKSDAANVLGRLPEGHREVFELCDEYLRVVREELPRVLPGSPRLAALRKGIDKVSDFHKAHLLKWVRIESQKLGDEARSRVTIVEKLDKTERAATLLRHALTYYPEDPELTESLGLILEFGASIRIADWVGRAEMAALNGDHAEALVHYEDALFFLSGERITGEIGARASEMIEERVAKIKRSQLDE